MSYGIVKMHSGEITAESNCDPAAGPTGTTFRLVFPLRGREGAAENGNAELALGLHEQS